MIRTIGADNASRKSARIIVKMEALVRSIRSTIKFVNAHPIIRVNGVTFSVNWDRMPTIAVDFSATMEAPVMSSKMKLIATAPHNSREQIARLLLASKIHALNIVKTVLFANWTSLNYIQRAYAVANGWERNAILRRFANTFAEIAFMAVR